MPALKVNRLGLVRCFSISDNSTSFINLKYSFYLVLLLQSLVCNFKENLNLKLIDSILVLSELKANLLNNHTFNQLEMVKFNYNTPIPKFSCQRNTNFTSSN